LTAAVKMLKEPHTHCGLSSGMTSEVFRTLCAM